MMVTAKRLQDVAVWLAQEIALRQALNSAIKSCKYSREQIADAMTSAMGVVVTKAQIDTWTSESKIYTHRMPATYLPFFCNAVGNRKPLDLCANQMGLWLAGTEDKWHVDHSKLVLAAEELQGSKPNSIRRV